MRVRLLELCARIDGHSEQHAMLQQLSGAVKDWRMLLTRAELEGMAPLLAKHLLESGSSYPAWVKRSLHVLSERHQQLAEIRTQILLEVLGLFEQEGIRCLVLKGGALAYTIYPDPSSRPMRDIDLLLGRNEVDRAHGLLKANGFRQEKAVLPKDHFHLPPLYYQVGNTSVCVELHRGLYPECPPYYPQVDFDQLYESRRQFILGHKQAATFSSEEMLHYLFQHGLRAPLTYESFKLINVADIVGFVETYHENLDWERIRSNHPLLCAALPLLHHLTPWDREKVPPWLLPDNNLTPVPYQGWPHKRLKDLKAAGTRLPEILRKTFLPSIWWLRMYYGAVSTPQLLFCLLWKHPRHVYWWARMYRSLAS
ncbi:MAG: nucleotidyltransferase family protein [Desulfofustis sp.]|jgi:hypothetical protein